MALDEHLDKENKLNLFYEGKWCRLFTAPSNWPYCPTILYVDRFRDTDHIFLHDWNFMPAQTWHRETEIHHAFDRATFFSSTTCAHERRVEMGARSVLASNNVFVNENVFRIAEPELQGDYGASHTCQTSRSLQRRSQSCPDCKQMVQERICKTEFGFGGSE